MQKRDDEVIVSPARTRASAARCARVLDDNRVIVSGVNMIKKHTRPNPQAGVQGGIVEREAPIQVSNVAIFNPETSKGDRVGFRVEDGKKVRVSSPTARQSTPEARIG
jgi:large subunit ribosomal protein L24